MRNHLRNRRERRSGTYSQVFLPRAGLLISSEKRGGLNGSLQHLVKTFLEERWKLILLAGVNTKQQPSLSSD